MNVSGPSGSNYNPFRTENDKPTSDAAITGMGKLNGDYGKTGNWFFRKVYDSVSALFTEKYWKGGWFAPKQSGDNAYSKELSGRVSSVSDRNSENSSNRSSVASSRISSLQSDKETELPEDDDEKHERMNATAAATKIQALVRGYIQRKMLMKKLLKKM
ncbi:MAG: hypothetical protein FJ390_02135 [Verrucomicrobia bacterium]|nr:hypothetical protein [Verrucomicrobiota bacterium]